MPLSNYPPGMTRSDLDHVEGVVRCEECGADITRELEDQPEGAECVCPDGCNDEDPRDDWDAHVERCMEDGIRP